MERGDLSSSQGLASFGLILEQFVKGIAEKLLHFGQLLPFVVPFFFFLFVVGMLVGQESIILLVGIWGSGSLVIEDRIVIA